MTRFILNNLFLVLFLTQAYASTDSVPTRINLIPDSIQSKMLNNSWRQGCPIPIKDLRLVDVKHWDFKGQIQTGQLIVHHSISKEIIVIFKELFTKKTPIQSILPMYIFQGDDDKSMVANNTSAFNCRKNTMNSSKFSIHSYGKAIDINPLQNPLVYKRNNKTKVIPQAAHESKDRNKKKQGMIHLGDPVWKAFTSLNWQWGGTWRRVKDYQHFQKK